MTIAIDFDDNKPTADDADIEGKVNWFHPRFGWAQGDWLFPPYSDCTHWAVLPDRPAAVSLEEKVAAAYESWLRTFPTTFDPSAVALMKTGFTAGYAKARRPY